MGDQPFFLQSSPPPALPSFPAIPSSIPPPPASVVAAAAMNSTDMTPPDGLMTSGRIGSFGYGIGISVGILMLITTITLASYFCTRTGRAPQTINIQRLHRPAVSNMPPIPDLEIGLDEATLMSYPKLLYSKAKLRNQDTTASCCSICLADYKDTDMLRLLPDCGHLFHLKCVDPWLRLHPTCPVCRTSPLPTPLPTPLAEVVPLRETARV